LVLVGVLLACSTSAEADTTAPNQIPLLTRLVKLFFGYETQLLDAAKSRDLPSLNKLVDDDFELWAGPTPGVPTPREDWLRESLNDRSEPYRIEQMAVQDLGQAAVVSYLGRRKSGNNLFFVDVWTKESGHWKLAVRYLSPAGSPNAQLPGWAKQEKTLEKRY
jgi:hypothetical protein